MVKTHGHGLYNRVDVVWHRGSTTAWADGMRYLFWYRGFVCAGIVVVRSTTSPLSIKPFDQRKRWKVVLGNFAIDEHDVSPLTPSLSLLPPPLAMLCYAVSSAQNGRIAVEWSDALYRRLAGPQ